MDWNVYALDRFTDFRIERVQEIAKDASKVIHAPVLLAVGLRETWLQNIVSYNGDDRGVWQISAVYHSEFLKDTQGCRSGTWTPVYADAYAPGRVPTLNAGCREAIRILESGYDYGEHGGVAKDDLTRFAVASYNAGVGGAMEGYKDGDVDKNTTGGNYSEDVMERRELVVRYVKHGGAGAVV